MNQTLKALTGMLAGGLLLLGCSTEVELNAPYKSSTVVFGLLDPAADTQWVKINKTFIGEGNNLDYALVRDSSEYDFDEFQRLVIEEWVNGEMVAEHPLQETIIDNKELNGIFYAPEQTVYFIPSPTGLNQEAQYRLVVDFIDRPDVYAWTNVIRTEQISFQIPQTGTSLTLAQTGFGNTVNYNENVNVKWTPADNATLYDLRLRFRYKEKLYSDLEHTQLVSETDKFVDWNIGSFDAEDLSLQAGYLTISFNSEPFFSYLGSVIEENPYAVREIGYFDGTRTRCFDLFMALANEELNTWFDVNSPVTGVIQERPTYTNVEGGLGLFGSRSGTEVLDLALFVNNAQNGNLIALLFGEYTQTLNFCDPNPNNDPYSCD